jgi:drug/metabolite transporter (DMT)-like permease
MTTSSIPVMVLVLSGLLLGEGFPRRLMGGIAVSGTGAVLVGLAASAGGRAPLAGVLLCLLAAVGAACAQICQKPALRYGSALQVTTFGCLTGTVVTTPFAGQLAAQLGGWPPPFT